MTTTVYSPLVVAGIESFNEDLQSFVVQVRLKGTTSLLLNTEVGGTRHGLKWKSEPVVFSEAVKDSVYQIRSAVRDNKGNQSVFSAWADETAGDTSFGSGHSWTNSITSRSTCIDIDIQLNNPPLDFDRIEIYVRDSAGTTGHSSWTPEYVMTELSFFYPWVGTRADTKHFYVKAFDKSGNTSAIESIGSGSIQIILPGDMDETPPDSSAVTATLES